MISDAFLAGEVVYLRPPKDSDIENWYRWFNDKKTTRFLGQGAYPNTLEKQREYMISAEKDPTKVILCIIDKAQDKHIGVISFNNIDFLNRTANIGLVVGERNHARGAALEAMALMTEYGFDRLNLNKINAGQSEDLWLWVNMLKLIGYKIEGYAEALMIRDGKIHNVFYTGITSQRFYELRKERNGKVYDSSLLDKVSKKREEWK